MNVSRRDFLRATTASTLGAASFYFLDPLGRTLVNQARAEQVSAKRLVCFIDSHGWSSWRRRPSGLEIASDRVNEVSLLDQTLHASLEPLSAFRDRMLLLEPFYNPFGTHLHGNAWSTLSITEPFAINHEGGNRGAATSPGGESIDRLIARTISQGSSLRSLHVGLHKSSTRSADGPNIKVPTIQDPFELFQQLFAGGNDPEHRRRLEEDLRRQKSIFDRATADIDALRRRLPSAQKDKLDQFTTTMRDIETGLGIALEQRDCEAGEAPQEGMTSVHGDGTYRGPVIPDIAYAHVEIVAQALACGLTQVASLALTPSRAQFHFLGDMRDKHNLNHDGNDELLTALDAWHAEQVATLCRRLEAIPEGDKTMLDHTVILWINDGGGKHHRGFDLHPALMIGNIAGRLDTGRAIAFRGDDKSGQRCLSDLYTSLLELFEVPVDTFGDPAHNGGALSELFA